MAQYGETVTLTMRFYDLLTGNLVDPDVIEFAFAQADHYNGVETTILGSYTLYTYNTDPEITRQSTGIFSIDWIPDSAGWWRWLWRGATSAGATWQDSGFLAVISTGFPLSLP